MNKLLLLSLSAIALFFGSTQATPTPLHHLTEGQIVKIDPAATTGWGHEHLRDANPENRVTHVVLGQVPGSAEHYEVAIFHPQVRPPSMHLPAPSHNHPSYTRHVNLQPGVVAHRDAIHRASNANWPSYIHSEDVNKIRRARNLVKTHLDAKTAHESLSAKFHNLALEQSGFWHEATNRGDYAMARVHYHKFGDFSSRAGQHYGASQRHLTAAGDVNGPSINQLDIASHSLRSANAAHVALDQSHNQHMHPTMHGVLQNAPTAMSIALNHSNEALEYANRTT